MRTNQAGPELDAEIVERVNGWKHSHGHGKCVAMAGHHWWQTPKGAWRSSSEVPRFSTDRAAAMALLDEWPYDWSIRRWNGRYEVCLHKPTTLPGCTSEVLSQPNESLALAICYVRLRAIDWLVYDAGADALVDEATI